MIAVQQPLSADQEEAAAGIMRWADGIGGRELTLGGYAGTGKTTVLQSLWESLKGRGAQMVAPTGKAAQVLRSKGVDRACTIHSLIYNFRGVVETDSGKESPVFDERDQGDWGVDEDPRLLICDESSMVNDRLYCDLMARELPVLWVGDHGQLAPVGGDPGIMHNPQIRLERIHRQAAGNPLLSLAHHVREGGQVSRDFAAGDALKIGGIRDNHRIVEYSDKNEIDQIIVGTNRLRHAINKIARYTRGFTDVLHEGDRIICTFNNRRMGVWNGQIMRVAKIIDETETFFNCGLEYETNDGWQPKVQSVKVQKISLGNPDYRSADRIDSCCEFDYGYAITCHKSQGSEWGRVMVVDTNVSQFDMDRWRYTAFTRAKEHLSVVMR